MLWEFFIQENELLHEIFDLTPDRKDYLSSMEKVRLLFWPLLSRTNYF